MAHFDYKQLTGDIFKKILLQWLSSVLHFSPSGTTMSSTSTTKQATKWTATKGTTAKRTTTKRTTAKKPTKHVTKYITWKT